MVGFLHDFYLKNDNINLQNSCNTLLFLLLFLQLTQNFDMCTSISFEIGFRLDFYNIARERHKYDPVIALLPLPTYLSELESRKIIFLQCNIVKCIILYIDTYNF